MPTVLRLQGYRFFFYSSDGFEPEHVHVEVDGRVAKIWLGSLRVARDGGMPEHRIRMVLRLVEQHRDELHSAWTSYFEVSHEDQD